MGKALIIKGANFSVNAIEGINLDGIRYFTLDNADMNFVGKVTYTSGNSYINFSTASSSYNYKLYKVHANEVLVIPRQTKNIELFFCMGLPDDIGSSPIAFDDLKDLRVSVQSYVVDKGVTIKGDKDYYIVVSVDDNVNNVTYPFPDNIYVTQEYNPSRTLTNDNYDSKVTGRYINNTSHQWGSDSRGIYYFYNVQKGETVHIKKGEYDLQYAVFSQNIQIANGTLPQASWLSTSVEEVDIPITEIGRCICISKQADNTNDRFPSEFWTYPTPTQVEESNE